MKQLMGGDTWPEEMTDIQNKLLLSSAFDSELDESEVTGDIILNSLVAMYRIKMPLEAGIRWNLYCRGSNNGTSIDRGTQRINSSANPISDDNDDDNDAYEDGPEANDDFAGSEDRPSADNPTDVSQPCPLQTLGIACHNMTLEDFSVYRNENAEKFHLVMGDPSELHLSGACKKQIDPHQADKAIAILKTLVHPHGWVFFYTRPLDYYIWDKAFKANDFDPLQYAWPMIRNCDTIKSNTSPIPQNLTELMIGARKRHPDTPEFQPNITADYERNICTRKRKFAVMDRCPEPAMKLKKLNSREPVRQNERSPEPIAEFLNTFCPEQGNVLDAFAGTMETAKACFITSRRCTALEADRACYDLSFERLKASAFSYLRSALNVGNILPNELEWSQMNDGDTGTQQSADGEKFRGSPENATVCDECESTPESDISEEMNGASSDGATSDEGEQSKWFRFGKNPVEEGAPASFLCERPLSEI